MSVPHDAVFQYVVSPPPPRSRVDESEIDQALSQLDDAARLATTADLGMPDAIRLVWDRGVAVRIVDDWLNSGGSQEPGTGLGVVHAR